jgi:glutamate dehydrogenase/leucine dehydrogenase
VEYHGGNESTALSVIEEKVARNTAEVLAKAKDTGQLPRQSAEEMAQERVRTAMRMRRWS